MLYGREGQQGICSLMDERRVVSLAQQEAQNHELNCGWCKSALVERWVEISFRNFRGSLKKT